MRISVFVVLCFFLTESCNQVKDLQPGEPDTVPAATIQIVKTKFPESRDLVFKSLIGDRIWEVKFASVKDKYTSLVDESQMYETMRQNPDSIPDLLNNLLFSTSFSGGKFSANTEDIGYYPSSERRNKIIYNLNGTDYSFDWLRYNGQNYRPTTAVFQLLMYNLILKNQSELPQRVQNYITADKALKFQGAQAWVRLDYSKVFFVRVEYVKGASTLLGTMLFDETGNLKWVSREFNQPDVYSPDSNIDTLPASIQQVLDQSKELTNFYHHTPALERWRGEYSGVVSYYLRLYNKDYAESCELYFDKDGNLLNKRYFVSF